MYNFKADPYSNYHIVCLTNSYVKLLYNSQSLDYDSFSSIFLQAGWIYVHFLNVYNRKISVW